MTLAIMILPTIMRTTEEALKAVPDSYRKEALALEPDVSAPFSQVVLPSAVPGILAGIILAVGRIVGETAALMYTAGNRCRYSIQPIRLRPYSGRAHVCC